jgi:hypothetical protein
VGKRRSFQNTVTKTPLVVAELLVATYPLMTFPCSNEQAVTMKLTMMITRKSVSDGWAN